MAKRLSAEMVDRDAMCHRSIIQGVRLSVGTAHKLEPICVSHI